MGLNVANLLGGSIGSAVKEVVGAFKLDPEKKAELEAAVDQRSADFKLKELELSAKIQDAVSAEILAQIAVNEQDAKGNLFQSSWRPLIGYICGAGLAYQFLGQPLLAWISGIWHFPVPPTIDFSSLLTLLLGMLGLGAARTVEKLKDKD